MTHSVTTPAGRIVWGNPSIEKPMIDNYTKQQRTDTNGKPMSQFSFGLAIPKAEFGGVYAVMQQATAELFPQGVPADFAWKIKDGDGPDQNGVPYSNREGHGGCYILAVSTSGFAPRVVRLNGTAYEDFKEVKTGDYVRAALNFKAHAVAGRKPGVYVNPDMVEFLGFGESINSGPDAQTVFGGQAVAPPPGATLAPNAPVGPMPGGMTAPVPGFTAPVPGFTAPVPGFTAPVPGFTAPAPVAPAPGGGIPAALPVAPLAAVAPVAPIASPGNPAPPPAPPAHDFVTNAGVLPSAGPFPAPPAAIPAPAPVAAPPATVSPSNVPIGMEGYPAG